MKELTTYSITAICLLGLIYSLVSLASQPGKGASAPAFTVQTMDGRQVNFPGDYKGKLVMLDFWATWCGPCMGEVPGLVKAYGKYHADGFDVLGFSLDKADAGSKVRQVMAEKGMTWDMCLSKNEFNGAIPQLYKIHSIPSAFLIDGDTGKIIAGSGGALRGEDLAPTIEAALKQKAANGN